MSSVEVWRDRARDGEPPVSVWWHKTVPHWTVEYDGESWAYESQKAAVQAAKRRVSKLAKPPPEVLLFIRGEWEFARQEQNRLTGKAQWVRRDSSWICYVGDEVATMPVPPKPAKIAGQLGGGAA